MSEPLLANTYVAIMAGGIGSRFWPESRSAHPKQFLDLLGTGNSLIQWTYKRFEKLVPAENIYIITNDAYVPIILEQLPAIQPGNILTEYERKNTAACTAYFAHKIAGSHPDANIIMAPADHLILDDIAFKDTIHNAVRFIAGNKEALLTLGIMPGRPDTGYGYIQYNTAYPATTYPVLRFTEKPDEATARQFISSGGYLWNAGIFLWNVAAILAALSRHLPVLDKLFTLPPGTYGSPDEVTALREVYAACEAISIDYGIMEKADNVYVLPASFGWSDLGTWESAYEQVPKDTSDNAVLSKNVLLKDVSGCIIKAPLKKMVVVQGIEDCIIVDTDDVLLICNRKKEQQIKQYLTEVQELTGDVFI